MEVIIAASCWPRNSSLLTTNQTSYKYGTTRANTSTLMNKGVNMSCKVFTANLFAVVGLYVEPSTSIENPKGYLESSLSIR